MSGKALLSLFIFIIVIVTVTVIVIVVIIIIVSQLVKVCSPYSLVAAKLGWECMTDSTGLTAMHAISTKPPSAEEGEPPASELLCKEAAICPVAGED